MGGDFNARIGEWDSVMDDEPDLFEDAVSGDILRKSKDKSTNQFGKTLIDFCSTFHCMPLNGKHSGDLQGQFTFISQLGNSVVDYFVVSADFVSKTHMYFEVGSRVESSHMPIHLSIRGKQKKPEKEIHPTQRESITNTKWNSEKVEEFNEAINSDETKERFREALEFLDTNIEKALKTFSDTLLHAGECMRRKVSFSTGAERSTCKWFDRECISKTVTHGAPSIVFREQN